MGRGCHYSRPGTGGGCRAEESSQSTAAFAGQDVQQGETSPAAAEESEAEPGVATAEITDEYGNTAVVTVEAMPRPSFLSGLRYLTANAAETAPSAPSYEIASDFSNVMNINELYLGDKQKQKLQMWTGR